MLANPYLEPQENPRIKYLRIIEFRKQISVAEEYKISARDI